MRIQKEYRSFNNRWTISTCYDFQVHLQHSKWYFAQPGLPWFELHPALLPEIRCRSSALSAVSLALPVMSMAHLDISPVLPHGLRCTQSSLRCCIVFRNLSSLLPLSSWTRPVRSQLLLRPAGLPTYGLILSWNWCIQVCTQHPLRHIWRLPETEINFADVT